MKRLLASLFRRLEDRLDPSRADELMRLARALDFQRQLAEDLNKYLENSGRHLKKLQAESSPIPVPDRAPDWLPQHMLELRNFLGTPAGQVLLMRGRAVQFELQLAAGKDVFHTSHSAGVGKGFGDCLAWLNSLSRASRAPDDAPAGDPPKTDTSPIGEPELREAMSP